MKNKRFFKTIKTICFIGSCFFVMSCNRLAVYPKEIISVSSIPLPEAEIKTHRSTELLSLEAPLRCNIDSQKQRLIKTISYNTELFALERTDLKDEIPRYEVTGFSFEKMESSKAIALLTKEAEIRVVPKDEPYIEMSAEGLKGELLEIINMIADASEIFYTYDSKYKVLELKRVASFKLTIPDKEPLMLALLDAMRGAGIQNITVDWEDKSLLFNANKEEHAKVEKLLQGFDKEPSLVIFDTSVYRFYPTKGAKEVEWQDMLSVFGRENIKMSINGVIGKMLITSSEINTKSLHNFMNTYGVATKISEGLFVVPDNWKSRFDVGRCGRGDTGEFDLSILAESKVLPNGRIEAKITLDSTGGEITRFNFQHRIGENYLIIGIPSKILDDSAQNAETVILMTPRLVKVLKEEPKTMQDLQQEEKGLGNWLINLMDK